MRNQYSVVICSYNKLEYLKKVANKVKSLRPDNEIILSDDFSTDGTIEWSKECGLFNKIHVEKEPGNYRLNSIRNAGIQLGKNKYIVLLDADCLPEDSYFDGHDQIFEKYSKSVSIGITRNYDSDGVKMLMDDPRLAHCQDITSNCGWQFCFGGNVAFEKFLWNKIGKFSTEYNGCWGFEDLDFAYRLTKNNVLFYMNKLSSVKHLYHPKLKSAIESESIVNRNEKLFESKYGIKMR